MNELKFKKVVVLFGGKSKEREISIKTAIACIKALKKNRISVKAIDAKDNFVKKIIQFKPDSVFNALHGRYGEDGYVQLILEGLKIPYTHSGILSSSIAMNKAVSKKIFIKNFLTTPKFFVFNTKYENTLDLIFKKKKITFPVVIKPINEGSSVGVFICNNLSEVKKNIKKLYNYNQIIIEKYIPGREIQVAIMGKKALGAIELRPKRKFYDYKAKYEKNAKTMHIMPAPIKKKRLQKSFSFSS